MKQNNSDIEQAKEGEADIRIMRMLKSAGEVMLRESESATPNDLECRLSEHISSLAARDRRRRVAIWRRFATAAAAAAAVLMFGIGYFDNEDISDVKAPFVHEHLADNTPESGIRKVGETRNRHIAKHVTNDAPELESAGEVIAPWHCVEVTEDGVIPTEEARLGLVTENADVRELIPQADDRPVAVIGDVLAESIDDAYAVNAVAVDEFHRGLESGIMRLQEAFDAAFDQDGCPVEKTDKRTKKIYSI